MTSFPFHTGAVHGGFSTLEGVCRIENDGVILEFQLDIGGLGMKLDHKEFPIPFTELEYCEYKKKLTGARVILETRSMKSLKKFPGSQGNRVELAVRRRDRDRAEVVISEIEMRCSEERLREARGERN